MGELGMLPEKRGLFPNLKRYQVRCGFCGHWSDVMARDDVDAGKRLTERGWRTMKITQGKENANVLACRQCARKLMLTQAESDRKMEKNEQNKR